MDAQCIQNAGTLAQLAGVVFIARDLKTFADLHGVSDRGGSDSGRHQREQ